MAITVLSSTPCATEDMAKNSLSGSIAEYGKGGHKVAVREVTTQETDAGWIATVSIEIEDLEDDGEERPEEKKSEAQVAEDLIEEKNELDYVVHFQRDSQAERAFPEPGEVVDPTEQMDQTAALAHDDTIGIDQNPTELSETLENDFSQALTNDPPPAGTLPDSALVYETANAPVSALSVEELEAEVKRRKAEELVTDIAPGEKPTPLPTE